VDTPVLKPEKGRDEVGWGVPQLPSFHTNHERMRFAKKSISRILTNRRHKVRV
jgi:hypothetical protein